jgi:hypothetical protein
MWLESWLSDWWFEPDSLLWSISANCYPEGCQSRWRVVLLMCSIWICHFQRLVASDTHRKLMFLEPFIEIDLHSSKCWNSSKIMIFLFIYWMNYIRESITAEANRGIIFLELFVEIDPHSRKHWSPWQLMLCWLSKQNKITWINHICE